MVAGGGVVEAAAAVRVLVVDDSPVDRRVVELLLRNHKGGGGGGAAAASFHVTVVDSGKKAMELLGPKQQGSAAAADANEQQSIDMVLTDYCMPEMTGYDLLKAIKALRPRNPIPVVVMSSENEPQRISRCLTAGAEDFIVKPLRAKDVHRLRSCSGVGMPAKPAAVADGDDRHRSDNHARAPPSPPPSDHAARKANSEQRPHQLAGLAMARSLPHVLNASSSSAASSNTEVSHYLQLLFKLVLLAYAVLCLGELLHRSCSNGRRFLSLW